MLIFGTNSGYNRLEYSLVLEKDRSHMKIPEAPEITLDIDGSEVRFDLDEAELPAAIESRAFSSGNYPHKKRLKRSVYEKELEALQEELVKLQYWLQETGERVMIVFEGRDSAGKGGTISRFRQFLNPRHVRVAALPKPSDVEQGQWYFQRYVAHFPTAGEMVLFDRSWYNRAGVEPVMGFCTPEQHEKFLEDVPEFEHMIVREGIHFFKFWLNIGREMQIKRFHDRRHDPLKIWKLSPIDIKALSKWDDYTRARDLMLAKTSTDHAPWTVVRANDKRRARINAIRKVLLALDYDGKDADRIGEIDRQVVRDADQFAD